MAKYGLGIDFGSLSARAVLIDVANGKCVASGSHAYKNAVMESLNGVPLGEGWALQNPADYLESMAFCVKKAVESAKISVEDIIGIGVDFTACSILPIKNDGTPLSFDERFINNPHAYVKMWKHHAAEPYAREITQLAIARGEEFLKKFESISSEWLIPKIMQIVCEAPEIYAEADKIIEAGDWIVMMLTGEDCRNSCAAGYKGQYDPNTGYMNKEFLKSLNPAIENVEEEKLGRVVPSGTYVGKLNKKYAEILGLKEGISVASAIIDAHAAVPAVGICSPNEMLMIMGTSTCHMMLGNEEKCFKGLCGVVKDGIIPNFYGFEAGQCAVGDIFQWVIDEVVPKKYFDLAEQNDVNIYEYMGLLASQSEDESLVALDWWNGCRSPLMNSNLKGVISGFTMKTTAVDIFKTAVEATAFGTRRIIECFEQNGIAVNNLYACGGIAVKNSYIMQVYADVTGKKISVSASDEAVAHGSAILGAVAAGKNNGGYDTVADAVKNMACGYAGEYLPNKEKAELYNKKYQKYLEMSEFFSK